MIRILYLLILVPLFAPILLMNKFNKMCGAKGFMYGYFVGATIISLFLQFGK